MCGCVDLYCYKVNEICFQNYKCHIGHDDSELDKKPFYI